MEEKKKTNVFAIIGLVLGIIGTPILAIVFSIIGLVKAKKCQSGKALGIIGIILGILKFICVLIGIVIVCITLFTNTKKVVVKKVNKHEPALYEGKGSSISYYKDEWKQVTLEGTGSKDDRQALKLSNVDYDAYLMKIGVSAYDEAFDCDITKYSCYSEFIDTWTEFIEKELSNKDLRMYGYVYSLKSLNNGIFYMAYDYGKSLSDLKGKYYVVVSTENNAILSFMSNVDDNEEVKDFDSKVLELFKKMVIEKQASNTTKKVANSLTNWERYKSVRSGDLGSIKSIVGSWKILDETKDYFVINASDYYYYKDYNDLDDNYYYGTYEVYSGKEGTSKVGISDDKVDQIVKNSSGVVSENDIKTVVFKVTKAVIDGEDKSSSLKENAELQYVWILVNHGSEGIEAQVLNVSKNSNLYFVKTSD